MPPRMRISAGRYSSEPVHTEEVGGLLGGSDAVTRSILIVSIGFTLNSYPFP
jgi:hypothetical protein